MTQKFTFKTNTFDGPGTPVEARRHTNPDGSVGGWVATTAYVAPTATVGYEAQVFGQAKVLENAKVTCRAMVFDWAKVGKNAEVSGDAQVFGHALITGDAQVHGFAMVEGDVWVRANARVTGAAYLYGSEVIQSSKPVDGSEKKKTAEKKTPAPEQKPMPAEMPRRSIIESLEEVQETLNAMASEPTATPSLIRLQKSAQARTDAMTKSQTQKRMETGNRKSTEKNNTHTAVATVSSLPPRSWTLNETPEDEFAHEAIRCAFS